MSWLDKFFNSIITGLQSAGTAITPRQTLNFASGFTVADDSANNRTNVSVMGGGSSVPTGTGIPHIISGVQQAAASLILDADVSASAGIAASKIAAAGSSGQLAMNASGALGATSLASDGTNLAMGSGYISVGATPAAVGTALRLTYAASDVIIGAKDSGGTDREILARTGADAYRIGPSGSGAALNMALVGNVVTLSAASSMGVSATGALTLAGGSGSYISFGPTPATTGNVRLPSAGIVATWDSNSSVNRVIASQLNGEVFYGVDTAYTTGTQATNVRMYASSHLYLGTGSTTRVDIATGGTWSVINTTASTMNIGTDSGFTNQASNINMYGSSTVAVGLGAVTYFYCNGATQNAEIARPIGGGSYGANLPLRLGTTTMTVVAGSQTLTQAQYSNPYLVCSGSPASASTLVVPNLAGAVFIVTNASSQAMTFGGSSGSTVSIASGVTSLVISDGTNYRKIA